MSKTGPTLDVVPDDDEEQEEGAQREETLLCSFSDNLLAANQCPTINKEQHLGTTTSSPGGTSSASSQTSALSTSSTSGICSAAGPTNGLSSDTGSGTSPVSQISSLVSSFSSKLGGRVARELSPNSTLTPAREEGKKTVRGGDLLRETSGPKGVEESSGEASQEEEQSSDEKESAASERRASYLDSKAFGSQRNNLEGRSNLIETGAILAELDKFDEDEEEEEDEEDEEETCSSGSEPCSESDADPDERQEAQMRAAPEPANESEVILRRPGSKVVATIGDENNNQRQPQLVVGPESSGKGGGGAFLTPKSATNLHVSSANKHTQNAIPKPEQQQQQLRHLSQVVSIEDDESSDEADYYDDIDGERSAQVSVDSLGILCQFCTNLSPMRPFEGRSSEIGTELLRCTES